MNKQPEFPTAPPSYNEATAPFFQPQPPYPPQQQPYPQPQPAYPSQQQPYPQPQPPYPPQQQQQPYIQPVIVTIPQNQGMTVLHCHKSPITTVCSNCRSQIVTKISKTTREDGNEEKHANACVVLFLLGFCTFGLTWLCSCLPYCCNPTTSTYRHLCPRCNAVLGSYTEADQN